MQLNRAGRSFNELVAFACPLRAQDPSELDGHRAHAGCTSPTASLKPETSRLFIVGPTLQVPST
jgi:hypothetical protein